MSQRALIIPEIMLECVNLWPKRKNTFTKIAFFIMLILLIIIESGQLIYFVINIRNLSKMASTMSTLSTTLQAIIKMIVLRYYSDDLGIIIDGIKKDFWPSNLISDRLENELKFQTKLVISMICMICTSAFIFAFGFLSAPLRNGEITLPFESWYPFNWQVTPIYEIIYVSQWLINIYVVIVIICGHDFVFLASVSNCIAQFKLLKESLRLIGKVDERNEILNKMRKFSKNNGSFSRNYNNVDDELLVLCIQHHLKLIQYVNDFNMINLK